jgi:hypothetical protein
MSWEFDHFKVMTTLADIIKEIVGDRLATLPNSGGQKAVFTSHYGGITPPLPYVLLTYQGSRDDDGFVIDSGLTPVQVEDPDNPPTMIEITTPYLDKLTNFNISLRVESMPATGVDDKNNTYRILRDIRKGLLLPKHRKKLRDEVFTVMEFMNQIRSTPDLIATSYHEIATMQLKLSSVDRVIDYDAMSFGTINFRGELKETLDDPTPRIITGSVTTPPPP